MNVVATGLTIFVIVAALSLVIANSLVIQLFAQNKTGNTTKATGNMTNATGAKKAFLGASNPQMPNKTLMQAICHGAACLVVAGCVECTK